MLRTLFTDGTTSAYAMKDAVTVLWFSWPLVVVQWLQYRTQDLDVMEKLPLMLEVLVVSGLITLIMVNGADLEREFIYFQF